MLDSAVKSELPEFRRRKVKPRLVYLVPHHAEEEQMLCPDKPNERNSKPSW